MFIRGIDFSTIEYPGFPSAVIFLEGCSERCFYCFNKELWTQSTQVDILEIESKLLEMMDFIDAIVITGGEPMEQPEVVKQLIELAKKYDLKVGLNTNGYHDISDIKDDLDFIRFGIRMGRRYR